MCDKTKEKLKSIQKQYLREVNRMTDEVSSDLIHNVQEHVSILELYQISSLNLVINKAVLKVEPVHVRKLCNQNRTRCMMSCQCDWYT